MTKKTWFVRESLLNGVPYLFKTIMVFVAAGILSTVTKGEGLWFWAIGLILVPSAFWLWGFVVWGIRWLKTPARPALVVDNQGVDFIDLLQKPSMGFIPWPLIRRMRRLDGLVEAESKAYRVPYLAMDVTRPLLFKKWFPKWCNYRSKERKVFFKELGLPYADILIPQSQLPCTVSEFLQAVKRIRKKWGKTSTAFKPPANSRPGDETWRNLYA
jgi:hypothetical protein